MIEKNEKLNIGIVKWFANEKGFGVINTVNQNDEIFLHISNWIETKDIGWIAELSILVFQVSLHKDRLTAKKCRYFNYSVEDYQLLVSLTQKYNHFLYANNNFAKKLKISDLLDKDNLNISNFNIVLAQEFETISDDEFVDRVNKFKDLYSNFLVTKKFIRNEALKRFHASKNILFKENLVNFNFLSIQDVPIDFILKNIVLTKNIISNIKQNPEFIDNIITILEQTEDNEILRELISIALTHNIQEVTPYITLYLDDILIYTILDEYISLLRETEKSKIDYDIKSVVVEMIEKQNDLDLAIKASEYGLTNINKRNLIDKYIEQVDLKIFKKYELDREVLALFEKSENQELLKHIILNFELEESDCSKYFNIGKKRFIYLDEKNQVLYLKKLFYLKVIGKLDFLAEELSDFITLDIIKLAYKEKKLIDFSSFLIIDLIVNFAKTGDFLGTHEIISNVLNITTYEKTRELKIGNYYFDECDGQAIITIPSDNEYIISKESLRDSQGNDNFYFKIVFSYNKEIVDDIKKIQTRKYDSKGKFWTVSASKEDEVFDLAKKYNFILNLNNGKSYVENNKHIAFIEKKEKPIGIKYCCGQEAQKKDTKTGKRFWWCNQVACFQMNIKLHSSEDWQKYTLFDFINILDLSLNEHSCDGDFNYKFGLYSKFIAFINRFDRLLDKLKCRKCEHILYPEETSNFHKFSVTKFSCKNEDCKEKDKIVYLNNCLNGQCNEIIDSRDSKQCLNGWRICTKCGSCCSHIAFERRLKSLEINGGRIYRDLIEKISTKAGHLEKAEYFCYKCGQLMTEYSQTLYKCTDCETQYDLSKYSQILKKQIHLDFRTNDYPTKLHEMIPQLQKILLEEKEMLIQQGRSEKQIFGILFNKQVAIDGVNISLKELNT